jgi:hypothetical protein
VRIERLTPASSASEEPVAVSRPRLEGHDPPTARPHFIRGVRVSRIAPLSAHLAPDCIIRLERAAEQRVADALCLIAAGRTLGALYFHGHAVEMCLSAAYFRSAGFATTTPIDRETRKRRMTQARQIQSSHGEPLMSSDPHPIVGWARYLKWQRESVGRSSRQEAARLREAVRRAEIIYRHWRPELRYKMTDVREEQLAEVRLAAEWFIQNLGRL